MTTIDAGQLFQLLQSEVGKPYVWGAEGPGAFDCSGLVQFVYGKLGVSTPRTAREQQAWATPVDTPRFGDLVFYGRPAHHVGIYLYGPDSIFHQARMIDAPKPGEKVRIEPVGNPTSYGRLPGVSLTVKPGVIAPGVLDASIGADKAIGGAVLKTLAPGIRNLAVEVVFVLAGIALVVVGAGRTFKKQETS